MLSLLHIENIAVIERADITFNSGFNVLTGEIAAGYTDATLVGGAFNSVFPWFGIGEKFIAIAMFLFAFTTVLGWSHYGSKAWEYLFGAKTTFIFRIIHVCTVIFGAVLTSSLAWVIAAGAYSFASSPFFFASSQSRYIHSALCSSCSLTARISGFLILGSFLIAMVFTPCVN